MKNKYAVQVYYEGGSEWATIIVDNKSYCEGWLSCRMQQAPRLAMRLVSLVASATIFDRSTHEPIRIIDEFDAKLNVNIGMIAGYPTAEQYERAGLEALEKAKIIRRNNNIGN